VPFDRFRANGISGRVNKRKFWLFGVLEPVASGGARIITTASLDDADLPICRFAEYRRALIISRP